MTEPQSRVAPTQRPPHPRRRVRFVRRRRSAVALGVAVAALLGLLGGVGWGAYSVYRDIADRTADFDGPGTGSVVVQLEPGDSVRAMGRRLVAAGVVRSEGAFVVAARRDDRATRIQPGHYQLRRQTKASVALALLLDPNSRILARVTIPEGTRLDATLARLAKESELPLERFQAAARDRRALGLPAYAERGAEGFLFPATYDVEPDAKPADVLRQMVARYDRAAEALGLEAAARTVDLDSYQVVIVASLLEEEAQRAEDFAKIARVIYNRLAQGMPLQLDSTVNYVTGKTGVTTTAKDRATDSPYNTYRYRGLPPGPINSPGQHALHAALHPVAGNWLYFVTVNPDTGETKFSATDAGHRRNVEEFRKWLREN